MKAMAAILFAVYAARVAYDWPEAEAEFSHVQVIDYKVLPEVWFKR